jgi:hypothetical protein
MPKHSAAYLALPIHQRLVFAATQYDAKLSAKDGNVYRLGIILRALQAIEDHDPEYRLSCCAHHTLFDNFSDRLLSAFEKELGYKVSYGRGFTDTARRPLTCSKEVL